MRWSELESRTFHMNADIAAFQTPVKHGDDRRWLSLVLLALAYAAAQLDRNGLNLLLPSIQHDLRLTDTEAGLLTGPAFAVLFSVASIPLGILADRHDRRWIIGAGLIAWSAATGACGLVSGFGWLLTARIGVGIGEAALAPCAYPILVGLFPPSFAARAIGLYVAIATALSGLLLTLTGFLLHALDHHAAAGLAPWQTIFLIIALPGLILAALSPLIRADRRETIEARSRILPLADAKTEWLLYLGAAAYFAALYAILSFTPSIFVRSFGWVSVQTSSLLGGQQILSGVIGAILGSWISDRLAYRTRGAAAFGIAIIALFALALSAVAVASAHTASQAMAATLTGLLFGGLGLGTLPSVVQEVTPPPSRSRSTACFILAINVFGTGLGPFLAGFASDHIGGIDALRSGVAITAAAAAAVGSALLLLTYRRLRKSLPGWAGYSPR